MKKTLLAISIAVAASSTVYAEGEMGKEIYLGAEYTDWDNDRNLDNEVGGALGFSVPVSKLWSIEGWYSRTDTESDINNTDVRAETFSINGLRYLGDEQNQTRPFLTVGASHSKFDPDHSKNLHDNSLDLGFGVKHFFSNNLVLRGDLIARAFEDRDNDFAVDPVARISIGYTFGKKSSRPIQQQVAAPVQQRLDSDDDGVYDDKDQCPGTDAGLKVDENGCKMMLTETVRIDLKVQFPNDSAEVSEQYLNEIGQVADFLNSYSGTNVDVKGYTDSRGSADYNQQLSEKRAQAVANILVEKFGIDASRVEATGLGENDPIADNDSAEGRAKNRRVVAEVSADVEKAITK